MELSHVGKPCEKERSNANHAETFFSKPIRNTESPGVSDHAKGINAMPSLQERLEEFRKSFESGAPPYNAPREAIEKMHRATAELNASGIAAQTLKVGDHAPTFTLFNQDHAQVTSADLLRQGPLVVSFFRGHW
jgi:hypothetical protein